MILELRNIYKTYLQGKLEVPVLKNISLSVEEGEYVAIMGPSGSGKTTLMNIIGCLDNPTSGEYLLEDTDISKFGDNKMSEVRLHSIGFVFQSFYLLSRQSALDNVALPLLYAGVNRKERTAIATRALERVGLADRTEFKPTQLSGGQCQRVAIARAIVNNPKILLADEPTGALDTKSGQQIMEIFQKLNDEGVTIVMITHEPEIAQHAQRILYIRDGLLVDKAGNPIEPQEQAENLPDDVLSPQDFLSPHHNEPEVPVQTVHKSVALPLDVTKTGPVSVPIDSVVFPTLTSNDSISQEEAGFQEASDEQPGIPADSAVTEVAVTDSIEVLSEPGDESKLGVVAPLANDPVATSEAIISHEDLSETADSFESQEIPDDSFLDDEISALLDGETAGWDNSRQEYFPSSQPLPYDESWSEPADTETLTLDSQAAENIPGANEAAYSNDTGETATEFDIDLVSGSIEMIHANEDTYLYPNEDSKSGNPEAPEIIEKTVDEYEADAPLQLSFNIWDTPAGEASILENEDNHDLVDSEPVQTGLDQIYISDSVDIQSDSYVEETQSHDIPGNFGLPIPTELDLSDSPFKKTAGYGSDSTESDNRYKSADSPEASAGEGDNI